MTRMTNRQTHRAASNNRDNPDQNACALAVATFYGVQNAQRYLHTWGDDLRALRSRFSVRSVKSKCAKTVGGSRAALAQIAADDDTVVGFVALVERHIIALDRDGKTVVDTDPRKNDRRKVIAMQALRTK